MSKLPKNPHTYLVRGATGYRMVLRTNGEHLPYRTCDDCAHLVAHVSLWCDSDVAIRHYGTNFPGRKNCPGWKPCRREQLPPPSLWERIKTWWRRKRKGV